MAKLPGPPDVAALRDIKRETIVLPKGTTLVRAYKAGGRYPTAWYEFRRFGPLDARFDHHLTDGAGKPFEQARSILYCATETKTCLAEIFQHGRIINRARNVPWLALFRTGCDLQLLDLTGDYPTRASASMALHSGNRAQARAWAAAFYAAHPDLHGLYYCSSMAGNRPSLALTDRAEARAELFERPDFNRPLTDEALTGVLRKCAGDLGYGLV